MTRTFRDTVKKAHYSIRLETYSCSCSSPRAGCLDSSIGATICGRFPRASSLASKTLSSTYALKHGRTVRPFSNNYRT
jgi:hypothetical protein